MGFAIMSIDNWYHMWLVQVSIHPLVHIVTCEGAYVNVVVIVGIIDVS
jgi:hypothetical protein